MPNRTTMTDEHFEQQLLLRVNGTMENCSWKTAGEELSTTLTLMSAFVNIIALFETVELCHLFAAWIKRKILLLCNKYF